MESNLQTPWEAIITFTQNVTWAKVQWVLIIILLLFVFHPIAVRNFAKNKFGYQQVLKYAGYVAGWCVLMYIFGYAEVVEGGETSIFLSLAAAILALTSAWLLSGDSEAAKIVNGLIKITIFFGLVATIGRPENSATGWGILFGAAIGFILGLMVITFIRTVKGKAIKDDEEEEEEEEEIEGSSVDFTDSTGV